MAENLIEITTEKPVAKGEGISIAVAEWTRALLHNGQGKYREATELPNERCTTRSIRSCTTPASPTGRRPSRRPRPPRAAA